MEEQPVETTLYSLSDGLPEPAERREGERHLTLFRVGSLEIDGRRELCLIKNVSSGGMLIRAYCAIEPEARVSVELKQGAPVAGTARWNKQGTVGIAFDAPVDVVELLAASMEGPRPRMPRVEVNCIASIREGARVYRMRVRDVSQGGIKVESMSFLPLRGDVVATLPGLEPQPSVVCWSNSGCYGITFNKLLPFSELVGWLHEQRDGMKTGTDA